MSGNRHVIGSDFNRLDAHTPGSADYVEIPELDDAWFARARVHEGGEPATRGRPKAQDPKKAVNLRLSQRVLSGFRAGGRGWQTRINAALEQWLSEHSERT